MKILKNTYLSLLLIVISNSYSQTGIYLSDGILSIEMPTNIDILNGYPSTDDLNSEAIDYYNKGTEILMNPNEDLINEAINYFIKAINLDYKFIQSYDNLGKAYRMQKKYDLAIKTYKISLKVFPGGTSAHQNLAIIYIEQKNWNKAINEYNILIDMMPSNFEGYYGLANVYHRTLKLDLALSNALIALKLHEQNPTNYIGDSYALVGLVYYDLGDKIKAKAYIKNAKNKYTSNDLEYVFYNTFPSSMLNELSIK